MDNYKYVDLRWDIGVCGWQLNGQHVRLKDVLAANPGQEEHLLKRHLQSMVLLYLVLHKLKGEYEECLKQLNPPQK